MQEAPKADPIEISLNGTPLRVPEGINIIEACRQAGVYVPTICYHPRLKAVGKCGMCTVDIEGAPEGGVLACSTKVQAGMRIRTDSMPVKARASAAISRLINRIRSRNAIDVAPQASRDFADLMHWASTSGNDHTSHSIQINPKDCVECSRCTRACRDLQGIGVLKLTDSNLAPIQSTEAAGLASSSCISCGQCTFYCPTGAISEVSDFAPLRQAIASGKVIVAQTAPATRVAIGEMFGLEPGTVSTRKMVGALKEAGFHFVFDTNFGADLTIMEEGTELLARLKAGGPFPMITSCCPAWINLCEKLYPDFIPNLSTCKSPQAMLAAVVRTYWAEAIGKQPSDIFLVSVMPCTAKKDEIIRQDLGREGYRDVDMVLTTREVARWMQEQGIREWAAVSEADYDNPMGESSGAGMLFGATGGVMEAALRSAFEMGTGQRLEKLDFQSVRGFQGIKQATIDFDGRPIKVAVVHAAANVRKLLEAVRADPGHLGLHFIEVMACTGGCIGGGGQPKSNDPLVLEKRTRSVYEIDAQKTLRRSHENPSLLNLYSHFLGRPGSHKAHELLHTHYQDRSPGTRDAMAAGGGDDESICTTDPAAKRALVLYATQTGTTAQAARRLNNELVAAKFASHMRPMDAITPADIASEPLVLILISTFGEGERPDMANPVWEWLGQQDENALIETSYAVFGLGSSKYAQYCQAAKEFDAKFEALGARRILELGKGDDCAEDGYAAAFDPWIAQLYEELGVDPPRQAIVPHYRVMLSLEASLPIPPPPGTMFGTLINVRTLTPPDVTDPILFQEFDISQTGYTYQAGDSVGVHPSNPPEPVESFMRWYRLRPDAVVSVVPTRENGPMLPIPPALTVRHLFERYLDIFARPRKIFFRQLVQFAVRTTERERLERLSSAEGKDDLTAYLADQPSYVNVLQDFPSAHPTLDYLVEMVPLIKPRLYSAASSPRENPGKVELIVAIPTDWSRQRRTIPGGGLCTSFLQIIRPGAVLPLNVHPGALRPPKDPRAPMLMVTMGTGVAAMRCLLRERLVEKRHGATLGPCLLYQQCNHRHGDYVLGDEMQGYLRAGVLTAYTPIFALDDPPPRSAVDLLIRADPRPVWDILKLPNAQLITAPGRSSQGRTVAY
ncbi:iron hydrogenase [Paratrimastix pyriformis]|uniref:NADPH--hemoprotein reductase n=1 Tax=Paratrimastix pyriformis TaxID=342808 RepID=A0ABQ8UUH2_9EUKA|nr:iron hydrogenase [Paratrimastix pyriformis]